MLIQPVLMKLCFRYSGVFVYAVNQFNHDVQLTERGFYDKPSAGDSANDVISCSQTVGVFGFFTVLVHNIQLKKRTNRRTLLGCK